MKTFIFSIVFVFALFALSCGGEPANNSANRPTNVNAQPTNMNAANTDVIRPNALGNKPVPSTPRPAVPANLPTNSNK